MNSIVKIGGTEAGSDAAFSPDYSKRIETLVKHRDRALELYAQAYDITQEAHGEKYKASPFDKYGQGLKSELAGTTGRVHGTSEKDAKRQAAERAEARTKYLEDVRKEVDRAVWRQVITETPLEKLMDYKARDDLHSQIERDPLPITVDDVLATMRSLVLDADNIFKRGLIEAFRNLDRYYRSNDSYRIKHRFVFHYARSSEKYEGSRRGMSWRYGRGDDDPQRRLYDIERCFRILDGRSIWEGGCDIVAHIDEASRQGTRKCEGTFMRAQWYMNGNLHIQFTRPDLVAKANKIIAEYFGAALADNTKRASPKGTKRPAHAKDLGDFQSPPPVVKRVIEIAKIDKEHVVLEPSAGVGNLASAAADLGASVECWEIDANRAAALIYADKYDLVRHDDFLEGERDWRDENRYDRVIMNPPFGNDAAIVHVQRAFKMLKQGGLLVAVMPASVKFRIDKKYEEFRAYWKSNDGTIEDLPDDAFASEGTKVSTVIITMKRSRYW